MAHTEDDTTRALEAVSECIHARQVLLTLWGYCKRERLDSAIAALESIDRTLMERFRELAGRVG